MVCLVCFGLVRYGWYGIVWFGMVRYCMVWQGLVWFGTVCYGLIWLFHYYSGWQTAGRLKADSVQTQLNLPVCTELGKKVVMSNAKNMIVWLILQAVLQTGVQ